MNRKGMISIIDAIVFLSMLSIICIALFTMSDAGSDDEMPDAWSVADRIMQVELKEYDCFDTDDNGNCSFAVIIASRIHQNDTEEITAIIQNILDDSIPGPYGYALSLEYEGKRIEIDKGEGEKDRSRYTGTCDIIGGKILKIDLRIG